MGVFCFTSHALLHCDGGVHSGAVSLSPLPVVGLVLHVTGNTRG